MPYILLLCLSLILPHASTQASTQASPHARAPSLTQGAKQVVLMELETGRILLELEPDAPMTPSSLTKIAALLPAFERIQGGLLNLQDTLPVSVRAWKQEGSRMFLEPNTMVTVEDLLRGIIVQSGNDATTVLAEGLGGTEDEYAREMTDMVQKLGAKNTNFLNASGLPDANHVSTARDMALISAAMIQKYPEFYPLFAVKNFTYNKIRQGNRNPLLYKKGMLVDGIKTGSSQAGGYGIVASAEKDGMRLILVVNGTKDMNARSRITGNIMQWGFREYRKYKFFTAGDVVEHANIWLGNESKVALVVPDNISLVLSYQERKKLKARLVYDAPIAAPVTEGQVLGKLFLEVDGTVLHESPVVAGGTVGEVGLFGRALSALHYIVWGVGQ